MKLSKLLLGLAILASLVSCEDYLDREVVTDYKESEVFVNYERMRDAGFGVYAFLFNRIGFNRIGNAMLASASDEADHADVNSSVQLFNKGAWTAVANPDDNWAHFYQGIRRADLFLENSVNYKQIVYKDTIIPANRAKYHEDVRDIAWLRAEVRFLRAYYYFELIKRYGGVPIMEKTNYTIDEMKALKRKSFDECASFVAAECDSVLPDLKDSWTGFDGDKWLGRVTKGAALALKARMLLYAASPLHNPSNNMEKWQNAAKAAHDVIATNRYSLHNNYGGLFRLGNGADANPEVIFAQQGWQRNDIEKLNFPVGYNQGGQGSTCPSQNLVDAYEMKSTGSPIDEPGSGYDPENPYEDRDPRLKMSILTNNTTFKGRGVEAWVGGLDGLGKPKATTTGYYIKKFLNESLDLEKGETSIHSWILFRYAEVLLNFAEAMNEAYGPEVSAGYSMNAKTAVDMVRQRPGVLMPILPPGLSKEEMRQRIRNERRVELAFEEHRFFDVRRWKIAEQTENMPIMAMKITKDANGNFDYLVVKAEDRKFEEKMYLYPIPQSEVLKSGGSLIQNEGW